MSEKKDEVKKLDGAFAKKYQEIKNKLIEIGKAQQQLGTQLQQANSQWSYWNGKLDFFTELIVEKHGLAKDKQYEITDDGEIKEVKIK